MLSLRLCFEDCGEILVSSLLVDESITGNKNYLTPKIFSEMKF